MQIAFYSCVYITPNKYKQKTISNFCLLRRCAGGYNHDICIEYKFVVDIVKTTVIDPANFVKFDAIYIYIYI